MIPFLVVVALGLAVYLLGKSLTKHLRRVPASFDPPAGETPVSPTVPVTQHPVDPRP